MCNKNIAQSFISLFMLFCLNWPVLLFAQEAAPSFLSKTEWLNEKDLKKWNQNLNYIVEGSQFISKSNETYLQASATADDESIENDKKEKAAKKLENDAIDLSKQALNKYRQGYSGLLTIIYQYIGDNEKKHPAYTDMVNFADQATGLYQSSGKANTNEERQQLTQGNEMQLHAIEKGINIFTLPITDYSSQDIVIDTPTPSTGDVQIDARFYKKYKEYISDNSIPDPITINRLMQREGSDANFQSFQELWFNYLNLRYNDLSQEELASLNQLGITDSTAYDSVMAGITQQNNFNTANNSAGELSENTTSQKANNTTSTAVKGESKANKTNKTNKTNTGTSDENEASENIDRINSITGKAEAQKIASELLSAEVYNASLPDLSDSYEFRVQVAASKVQLNITQLRAMYSGKFSVVEIKEGNFFKYQIRGFMLYSDAQGIINQTGVESAYITSYKSDAEVSLGLAVKDVRSLELKAQRYGRQNTVNPIGFCVQLAASRYRIPTDKFNSIYSGQWPVSVIFENGWYKYQILCRGDLQLALNVIENSGVEKAFLIGYKYGERMELYKALHEYKTYKP